MSSINKKLSLGSFGLLSLLATSAFAQVNNEPAMIIAPQCLLKHVSAPYQTLARTGSYALISTHQAGVDALIDARQQERKNGCGGFVDVTLASKQAALSNNALLNQYVHPTAQAKATTKPYKIQHPAEVKQLIKQINPQAIWSDLTDLSSRPDRYAGSDQGVDTAKWIKTQVETMAKNSGHDDVTVYFVKTGNRYAQPSVVAKVGNSDQPGVVIGGHMDTLSSTWENKPGADDDGSGTSTVLGVARTILSSGMHFKKPIYFIWYSAEEEGLIGSGYVVQDFVEKKIPVDAVMQLDMTGYEYQNQNTIWLMDDYVSKDLTDFTEKLIRKYVKVPVNHSYCGYACSDHASWNQSGVAAVMPFENEMYKDDPYIHTAQDKMDVLSLDHMTDFAKLGVAFAVELAEPVV